jgi:hypothetical protein
MLDDFAIAGIFESLLRPSEHAPLKSIDLAKLRVNSALIKIIAWVVFEDSVSTDAGLEFEKNSGLANSLETLVHGNPSLRSVFEINGNVLQFHPSLTSSDRQRLKRRLESLAVDQKLFLHIWQCGEKGVRSGGRSV